MRLKYLSIVIFGQFFCFALLFASPRVPSETKSSIETHQSRPLLAQKSRKKRISAEGRMKKSGDKTTIDFDAISISGERRTPLGSMINQNRADKAYDFVKIRLRWHPEMKKSASSLDTSR